MAAICELCGERADALDQGCCPVCVARLRAPSLSTLPTTSPAPIAVPGPAYEPRAGGVPGLAIVTGGNGGIGRAIVARLLDLGHDVHVIDLATDHFESLGRHAASRGRRFSGTRADITDGLAMRALLAELARAHGGIRILVNNAGVFHGARLTEHSRAAWDRQFAVNVTAPFELCQAAVPFMPTQADARIINISSIVGRIGGAFAAGYVASKHAVVGLTQSVALELAPLGITVNAVAPGFTDTPFVHQIMREVSPLAGELNPDRTLAEFLRQIPQHRLMQPAEIADLVAYLVSPAAGGITGQVINVSGGWLVA